MALSPDYSIAWRDLARRRRLMWSLLLGYVPGVALLCFVLARHEHDLCTRIAMAWMLLMGVAIARAAWFRCPRCQRVFCFGAHGGNNTFGANNICARRCARCGLAIEEPPSRSAGADSGAD